MIVPPKSDLLTRKPKQPSPNLASLPYLTLMCSFTEWCGQLTKAFLFFGQNLENFASVSIVQLSLLLVQQSPLLLSTLTPRALGGRRAPCRHITYNRCHLHTSLAQTVFEQGLFYFLSLDNHIVKLFINSCLFLFCISYSVGSNTTQFLFCLQPVNRSGFSIFETRKLVSTWACNSCFQLDLPSLQNEGGILSL